MKKHTYGRTTCPECESGNTEFIQFCTGEEEVVDTDPVEVGDGLLELRLCNDCKVSLEIILRAEQYNFRQN